MKRTSLILGLFAVSISLSCSQSSEPASPDNNDDVLVGQDGNPRFNLLYTNQANVDMDLFVKTPSGAVIYYDNTSADLGTLDVDCWCEECVNGPTENVFWKNGTAPTGEYEYWVKYYANCGAAEATSNYILRVVKNGTVVVKKVGSLSAVGESEHWTFTQ
ncbi:MAG: hypothetical protein IPP30_04660 [Flavobacterium sp.]|nr:hypothetical protein [Flavobacterium sp.]